MGVQRVFLFCSISSFISAVHAQVIIKERIAIDPRPQVLRQKSTSLEKPLLRLNGKVLETTVPGVIVTGSVSVIPSNIPENTAYEVWASAGNKSGVVKTQGTGVCFGHAYPESSPFPATLAKCGVIGMMASTFTPTPWYWSCQERGTAVDTPVVNGTSATITARGTLWYTGFTAVLTVSASLDESYLLSQIVAVPDTSALTCNGAIGVSVTVLDGHGDLYTDCSGSQLKGTASIQAKGPYGFLLGESDPGQTVRFNIMNGKGAFWVVLDTSKGIIEDGYDVARISVQVEGIEGRTSVALMCHYPPPSVAITYPANDTTITLSPDNLPTIVFTETHTPPSGKPFEPSISWEPAPLLETAEYYDKIQDSLVVPVKVTAKNPGGKAVDELEIILKRGCNLSPPHYRQGDTLWAKDTYDSTNVGVKTLGCALSCMAMAMTEFGDTVNPGSLNKWMKERIRDNGGFYGARVNWDAVKKHNGKAMNFPGKDVDSSFALASLDPFLQICQLVIAKVFNPESVKNKSEEEQQNARQNGNHWVLIVRKDGPDYGILDPGRSLTKLSQYGRIYRYVQISKN